MKNVMREDDRMMMRFIFMLLFIIITAQSLALYFSK